MLTLNRGVGSRTMIGKEISVEIIAIQNRSIHIKAIVHGRTTVEQIGLREPYTLIPQVFIKLLSVESSRMVRLGVEAPDEFPITREEHRAAARS